MRLNKNVSANFDKTTYALSEVTSEETIKTVMPDYLSYFGKQLTFWYFGKGALNWNIDDDLLQLVFGSISRFFKMKDSSILLGILGKTVVRSFEVNIPDSLKPIPKVPLPNYPISTKIPPIYIIKVDYKQISVSE